MLFTLYRYVHGHTFPISRANSLYIQIIYFQAAILAKLSLKNRSMYLSGTDLVYERGIVKHHIIINHSLLC